MSESCFEASDLTAALAPINAARPLPNPCYMSTDFYQSEINHVLAANWSAIGFGCDVASPGDITPIDFAGIPLLLLRDTNGTIRVFQNVCRHRGMKLVQAPASQCRLLRCPYHFWSYDLNGALRATPHAGGPGQHSNPDLDYTQLGLVEIRSHLWHDVVFVNLDGKAPRFVEAHANLIDRWRDFDRPFYFGGEDSTFTLSLKANWKLAVENYCDGYHLPMVHPDLNQYSRLEDHYNIEAYGSYAGQGSHAYRQTLAGKDDATAQQFVDFPGINPKWHGTAEYIALFPNVLLGVHRDHAYAVIIEPLGVDQTRERMAIYYADPAMSDTPFAALRARNRDWWKQVFSEDIMVVEGMQKGRRSPIFDGGQFVPCMDGPTHVFHHWIASHFVTMSPEHP